MANSRTINSLLRKEGFPMELRKGEGYWYFIYDDVANNIYEDRSVYVYRFYDLSAERWLEIGRGFGNEIKENNK